MASQCKLCGREIPYSSIPICWKCAKKEDARSIAKELHENTEIINSSEGIRCNLCSNNCGIVFKSLCGLRYAKDGKLKSLCSENLGILEYYYDPLPTNCCNAWFCRGSRMKGYNLAIFYYGCSFDCLYCQNWEHKFVDRGRKVRIEELLSKARNPAVKCICHFGGSPEPQMNFALKFSKKILEERDIMICWEWNGSGREDLALKAAEISHISEGTVKFDLKAWNENLHYLLTGRSPERVRKNFSAIFDRYPEVISATTLLVPYLVDEEEVEEIAKFIAKHSEEIPYSLLVFHPDYRIRDFPITSREQVERCYLAAKKYLKNVYIGNMHLLA